MTLTLDKTQSALLTSEPFRSGELKILNKSRKITQHASDMLTSKNFKGNLICGCVCIKTNEYQMLFNITSYIT
jgi:hypothetical protein